MPIFGSKLNKDIADLESKKASLQRAIKNEISKLQAVISQLHTEIGRISYEHFFKNEKVLTDEIIEKFDKITELNESIAVKEAKIADIASKYDEEISLLRDLASQA